jgi:hypothetical protein
MRERTNKGDIMYKVNYTSFEGINVSYSIPTDVHNEYDAAMILHNVIHEIGDPIVATIPLNVQNDRFLWTKEQITWANLLREVDMLRFHARSHYRKSRIHDLD